MPRPKQRTPELRETILAASLDLLASDGVPGITTREVARRAETSLPAVYELFGDKAGLVRAMFFTGFERLGAHLQAVAAEGTTQDPVVVLRASALAYRSFAQENPTLFDVMYFRPFASFDPGPDEQAAGTSARELIVDQIEQCRSADRFVDDATDSHSTDVAHAFLGLVLGMARQEISDWLGTTEASRQRRWELAIDTFLAGLTATTD